MDISKELHDLEKLEVLCMELEPGLEQREWKDGKPSSPGAIVCTGLEISVLLGLKEVGIDIPSGVLDHVKRWSLDPTLLPSVITAFARVLYRRPFKVAQLLLRKQRMLQRDSPNPYKPLPLVSTPQFEAAWANAYVMQAVDDTSQIWEDTFNRRLSTGVVWTQETFLKLVEDTEAFEGSTPRILLERALRLSGGLGKKGVLRSLSFIAIHKARDVADLATPELAGVMVRRMRETTLALIKQEQVEKDSKAIEETKAQTSVRPSEPKTPVTPSSPDIWSSRSPNRTEEPVTPTVSEIPENLKLTPGLPQHVVDEAERAAKEIMDMTFNLPVSQSIDETLSPSVPKKPVAPTSQDATLSSSASPAKDPVTPTASDIPENLKLTPGLPQHVVDEAEKAAKEIMDMTFNLPLSQATGEKLSKMPVVPAQHDSKLSSSPSPAKEPKTPITPSIAAIPENLQLTPGLPQHIVDEAQRAAKEIMDMTFNLPLSQAAGAGDKSPSGGTGGVLMSSGERERYKNFQKETTRLKLRTLPPLPNGVAEKVGDLRKDVSDLRREIHALRGQLDQPLLKIEKMLREEHVL